MWESGIGGWRADWRTGSEQLHRHRDGLLGLVGSKLTGAWSVWIDGSAWFADLPVVLEFDGSHQLEVCWQKFDDLSISWNTIDLEVPPTAWIDNLSWREWAHPEFTRNRDRTVTSIAMTDVSLTTADVDHPNGPPAIKRFIGGLWLATTGPGLHIFNAHDENGLDISYQPGTLRPLAEN